MKKLIIIIGIILLALIAIYTVLSPENEETATGQNSNLNWHTDLNSALNEAKNSNKPVFIDFYTAWCPYCKQLDETTLSDPRVKTKLAKNYVIAKIDGDKYPDVASNYMIYGYPTLLFLNPNEQEIKRFEGYIDADALLNQL